MPFPNPPESFSNWETNADGVFNSDDLLPEESKLKLVSQSRIFTILYHFSCKLRLCINAFYGNIALQRGFYLFPKIVSKIKI